MRPETIAKFADLKLSYHDKRNILFKPVNGEWYGKRCVITKENRCVWMEDVKNENDVKYWLHPKGSDWNEKFEW